MDRKLAATLEGVTSRPTSTKKAFMKKAHKIEALSCERSGACDIPAAMKVLDSGLANAVRFYSWILFLTYGNFVFSL